MNRNPLTFLPARYRRVAYAVLGLVALGVGAWQAGNGDWLEAVGLFLGSLGFGTAGSNVNADE